MEIEVGKYYRTRDGRKVGPMRDCMGDFDIPSHDDGDLNEQVWKKDGTVWSEDGDEGHHYLIAEWTEDETGTLAELDVKPGDVVECVHAGSAFESYVPGREYTVGGKDEKGREIRSSERYSTFRIISRAPDTPKTWGEMTPEEKMPLLLDWNDNSARNVQQWNGSEWVRMQTGRFGRVNKYRLKPEPVRETVTLYGGAGYGLGYEFDRNLTEHCSHRLIFTTTDGKPTTGTFTNENGDVIIMEEVR